MFQVVLDANLFVSGIIKPQSKPGQILQLVRDKRIKFIISPLILAEIRRVLKYPKISKLHQRSPEWIDNYLKKLIKVAHRVNPKSKISFITDDPTDNKYLECAVEGKADFIVSGDHHLKDLGTFDGIKIVSPAEFLENNRFG